MAGFEGFDIGPGFQQFNQIMGQGYRDRAALMREQEEQQAAMQRAELSDRRSREMQQEGFSQQNDLQEKRFAHEKVIAGMRLPKGYVRDPVTGEIVNTAAPKQTQFTAASFAQRAEMADKDFSAIAPSFDPTATENRIQPWLPGELQSSTFQQASQAKRNFISAVLRKESGAAIGKAEFINEDLRYFPQAGDSPEVIKQKTQARKAVIAGLQAEAGAALPIVQGRLGALQGSDLEAKRAKVMAEAKKRQWSPEKTQRFLKEQGL